ncbi:MAG TPA: type IV pilus twitching motility protein PilT [Nitrospirota bacterium]|nr:type IV pilus twitching motility protein PilT [Nitrospirota bacterium]
MSQLDKLIERLQPRQQLLLETGKEPTLRSETGSRVMVNQQLQTPQIIALLTEITPPSLKEQVSRKRQANFEYTLAGKTYTVTFLAQGELVRSVISPAEKTSEAVEEKADDIFQDEAPAPAAPAPAAAANAPAVEPEVNGLLRKMFGMGASDLHLTSNHRPLVRLHGDMLELTDQPAIPPDRIRKLLAEIMPEHNARQFEETNDTDFAHEIAGLARFRVNIFLDRFGMGAVFRQIPMEIVTAEKLGLSKQVLDLCFLSKGLVLVTGPTGSGKSTTLCALVDYINRHRKDHIITIEDPIEFVHARKHCLINQREIHVHTKSFANALRAALREDPDIVLVGEMRDLETISIAIETAETGHLVFGTLHTTTAASTVDRIIDQFPADRQAQIRTMLASSLKGVIAQTLCKKITTGRMAAMEVLFVNSAVSNLIREGKIFQIPSIMQTAKAQGMLLLNDALFKLVVDKQVAPEEAYIKSVDKLGFMNLLKSKGITLNLTGGSAFD